ncbi:DUF6602 domain-containing protein [Sorangium sp. So ce119]|uniref:DUF6602 domain-containing protein n=1 Tax=Sorangium sp. So ce119 TaxID=3133279 RepID=UPI003F5D9C9C
MNIRDRFVQVSTKLQADFKMATATSHAGLKGSAREEAIRAFLTQHLPRRYAVGTGQVMSPTGRMSRQCDVVIYDPVLGPNLPLGDSAAIFPIEVVYGTVEIKSDLTSEELKLAYENIASVKALAQAGTFVRDQGGMVSVIARPVPWGAVLAYTATRSLNVDFAPTGHEWADGDVRLAFRRRMRRRLQSGALSVAAPQSAF